MGSRLNRPSNASDDPAREAFEEGLRIFKTDLTQDGRKRESIARATSAEDVLEAVAAMQTKYEKSRVENKVQERLQKFTNVVHYYGNIMDVLAQHHPEYVALAWGAMKFLLVVNAHLFANCGNVGADDLFSGVHQSRGNYFSIGQRAFKDW